MSYMPNFDMYSLLCFLFIYVAPYLCLCFPFYYGISLPNEDFILLVLIIIIFLAPFFKTSLPEEFETQFQIFFL